MLEAKDDYEFSVDNWPLMQSSIYPLSILMCYGYFVFKLGPQLMRNRPAFKLKKVLIIYNAILIGFCIWQCIRFCKIEKVFQSMEVCTFTKQQLYCLTVFIWWYFLSKVIELFDTVFFILRKKQSQVTLLHVYHHSIMMVFTWTYVKYLPSLYLVTIYDESFLYYLPSYGNSKLENKQNFIFQHGQGYFMAFLNTIVHIIMYLYYLIAALGSKYKKYLWWKKYITWIQLLQFGLSIIFLMYLVIKECDFPIIVMVFYIINNIILIHLFINFYINTYNRKKTTKKNEKIN